MNVKENAAFASAAEEERKISCPACGCTNTEKARFCTSCGAALKTEAGNPSVQVSPFAQGLPEWNIEPPQVLVRRRPKP